MEAGLNPWARANLEQFNPETLALIPQGQQQEYIRVMKELAHVRAIAALVLEQMFQKEQERAAFFEPFINSEPPPCSVEATAEARVPEQPNNNTKPPEGGICGFISIPAEADTPNYTPDETGYPDNVIDFAKYLTEQP